MHLRPLPAALLAAVAMIATTGCGGGGGSSDGTATSSRTTTADAAAERVDPVCHARPPARGSLVIGTHAALRTWSDRPRGLELEARLACRSGATMLREDLSWASVVPTPGVRRWTSFDRVTIAAARHGLTMLPVVGDTPSWAGPASDLLPDDPGRIAGFMADVAARYGPGGEFWRAHPELPQRPIRALELLNEIYLRDPDPAPYGRALARTGPAVRAVAPEVLLLADVEQCVRGSAGWLEGLYRADPDLGEHVGALSVHPYGFYGDDHRCNDPERLEDLERTLVAHGDGHVKLWITEIGWSTCPRAESCVTEAEQARYLDRTLRLARTRWRPYVDAVFVYQLRDAGERRRGDTERWFGVLRADAAPKPAFSVVRRAALLSR